MVKLKIIKNTNGLYKLRNHDGKEYEFTLEFYDIYNTPKENDYIIMSAELLNEKYAGYSTIYVFGDMDNPCGRKEPSDIEIIVLLINDKEITLKRLYG